MLRYLHWQLKTYHIDGGGTKSQLDSWFLLQSINHQSMLLMFLYFVHSYSSSQISDTTVFGLDAASLKGKKLDIPL